MGKRHADAMAEAQGFGKPPEQEQEAQKPERDLDDAGTQERILNPLPRTITLEDGYEITLHEPSIKVRRRIHGLCVRIITDAASLPGINKGLLAYRVVSLIESREDLESDLYFWTAKLFGSAGSIEDKQAKAFAEEISEHMGENENFKLFEELCVISGARVPKN